MDLGTPWHDNLLISLSKCLSNLAICSINFDAKSNHHIELAAYWLLLFVLFFSFFFLLPDAFWLRSGKVVFAIRSISVRNMDPFLWVYQDYKIWKVPISPAHLFGIPRDLTMPETPDDTCGNNINGTKIRIDAVSSSMHQLIHWRSRNFFVKKTKNIRPIIS